MMSRRIRTLLVWVLIVFPAISGAQESPYLTPGTISVPDGFTLEKANLTDRQIPTLIFYKNESAPTKKPIVILLHGGGMPDVVRPPGETAKEGWFLEKQRYQDVPYKLAEAGVFVVLIDEWWAGERYRTEYRQIVKNNYLEAVVLGFVETTKDISLLLDALAERDDADTTNVGVSGRSGGGIISLMCAARDPRVTAVASWVGGADLMGMAHSKLPERMVNHYLEKSSTISDMIQKFDPLHQLKTTPPTAILMINNRTDPSMPLASAETLYEKLKPFYEDIPDRLDLRIRDTPEPTHAMTERDYDEGCAWLIRHLLGKSES